MLVCDNCKSEMKEPKYVVTKLVFLNPMRDMSLPPELQGVGVMLSGLMQAGGGSPHRDETLGHFDKLECVAKWAEERKQEDEV